MYTAKRNGRGLSVFYGPALEDGDPPASAPSPARAGQPALAACPHALPADGSMPHGCALATDPATR